MTPLVIVDDPIDGVRRLTLNRPDKLNALSRSMVDYLVSQLDEAEADAGVRALVIAGAGPAFCAGADLGEHFTDGDTAPDIGRHELWDRLEASRLPVVAAVQGWAITGGFLLAYCCDIIIASEDAQFRDTHATLSLFPTGGESQRLPRRVGFFRAKELMLTSRPFSAAEAERAGLVAKVVPREALLAAALEVASTVAANAPASVASIKKLINLGSGMDFGSAMRLEAVENGFGAANHRQDASREQQLHRFRSGSGES